MSDTASAAKLSNVAARIPGVTFAIATTSFSEYGVHVRTEYDSEIEIHGVGREWIVSVWRRDDATDAEHGHPVRTLLIGDIPFRATRASAPLAVREAVTFGIGLGIGHAVGASRGLEDGTI